MTTSMDADVVQTWPPHPSSVRAARALLRACLREWDLLAIDDACALVLSELTTNAVRHAGTDFTVTLSGMAGALLIRVNDGVAAEPAPAAPSPDELSSGGRGMDLVDAMTASWGVVPDGQGGKAVWALMIDGAGDRPAEPAPDGSVGRGLQGDAHHRVSSVSSLLEARA